MLASCVFCGGSCDLQSVQLLLGKNVCEQCFDRINDEFYKGFAEAEEEMEKMSEEELAERTQ